jgi:hypothetical protein
MGAKYAGIAIQQTDVVAGKGGIDVTSAAPTGATEVFLYSPTDEKTREKSLACAMGLVDVVPADFIKSLARAVRFVDVFAADRYNTL